MPVRYRSAQSLQEYAIVFGLVVVVAIGLVFSLGSNMQNQMGQNKQALFGDGRTSSGGVGKLSRLLGDQNYQTVNLTLRDGRVITLEQYPTGAAILQTASSDGTNKLLTSLDAITRELLEKGVINENQANQLQGLANRGHRMAEIEYALEQAVKQAGNDKAKYGSLPLVVNGKTYLTHELVMEMGIHGYTPASIPLDAETFRLHQHLSSLVSSTSNKAIQAASDQRVVEVKKQDPTQIVFPADYIGREHYELLHQYKAVEQSGALQEPAVKAIVDDILKRMVSLQINAGIAASAIIQPTPEYQAFTPDKLLDLQAASRTHLGAADICTTGSGKDSGVHCES